MITVKPPSPETLANAMRTHPAIRSKLGISAATDALGLTVKSHGRPGDDAAILPREGGFDLLAGEGFIPRFVDQDPWFAGWCGIMVNLSDIAAMGGRAVGLVNQIWAPSSAAAEDLLRGLRDASEAYRVPLVGGHTNLSAGELNLAVSVFGRATRVITSFDAAPGDILIAAIDHRGAYYNFDNWCAAIGVASTRLQGDLELLPTLAEAGLVTAGKDISQSGLAGTALMLAEASQVGLEIDLEAITPPADVPLQRWMVSFPSFGFLLCAAPDKASEVISRFEARDIRASEIGRVTAGNSVAFLSDDQRSVFWDYAQMPYLGLGGRSPHA